MSNRTIRHGSFTGALRIAQILVWRGYSVLLVCCMSFFSPQQSRAAGTSATLIRRESIPVSEGQTIIRSHYLVQPRALMGGTGPATTVTQEVIVVGPGVNYDANRGVGAPVWVPSQAALL